MSWAVGVQPHSRPDGAWWSPPARGPSVTAGDWALALLPEVQPPFCLCGPGLVTLGSSHLLVARRM